MSRWDRSEREFYRDLVTAYYHPEYRDRPTIEALRDIRQQRGDYV